VERRGISMYEDDGGYSNTDSKKILKINYERVCKFVENFSSMGIIDIDPDDCVELAEKDCKLESNKISARKEIEVSPTKPNDSANPIFRKIHPPVKTTNKVLNMKNEPKKEKVLDSKVNNEYYLVNSKASPIKGKKYIEAIYKNPGPSIEVTRTNFFPKVKTTQTIDISPTKQQKSNISSLIENSLKSDTKSKSRNINKVFTIKNEASKNDKTPFLTSNTKDTLLSNKLFSSNLTAIMKNGDGSKNKEVEAILSKINNKMKHLDPVKSKVNMTKTFFKDNSNGGTRNLLKKKTN